ncbi:glycosyltransferase family 4 protein [Thalassoroseus pseudoceratinae]|uniref:glycosyltransferase family 4 protein n=1 Tax=Thalassoroseus pseudoceratinae TaxID=2713176 RepID=UPI00142078BC|nr:glycosyltransferase family 4 protein [Thalassoroseus pseudoceratinae]
MKSLRIAFLATRPGKASFRFRVEQMLPMFTAAGHRFEVRFLAGSAWSRFRQYRDLSNFDVVFLQKRLVSRAELYILRRASKRLVYDVDDAVFLNDRGTLDGRRGRRFQIMMHAADHVVCGNKYLADFAGEYTSQVTVVPTCIDTEVFHPRLRPTSSEPTDSKRFTIGWTGSTSTNRYLNELFPILAKFRDQAELKFLSDSETGLDYSTLNGLPVTFVPWSPDVEVRETATFDAGLMPLPDDPWTRGKCGFKALQYMGLGIPAVCSPVGVNCEIITHGETGVLARTPADWEAGLTRLMSTPKLRKRLGQAGRQTVEDHYSLHTQGPRLVEIVEDLIRMRRVA